MNEILKIKLKQINWLRLLLRSIKRCIIDFKAKDIFSKSASIENLGLGGIKKYIVGSNNKVYIGKNTSIKKPLVRIIGHNNQLIIGENCTIGPNCEFWLEGDNVSIIVGSKTSFTNDVEVNAQEDCSTITIGEDCMFSNHIIIRTSDSHPIYDLEYGVRINSSKNVTIGNHVWIAPHSNVMKGAIIMDGSIIGSNTIVTKEIPANSLAVGMPAKVVKQNIRWTKEKIF